MRGSSAAILSFAFFPENKRNQLRDSTVVYFVEHMPSREFLGEFEQIVLLALLRLGKNAYGVPIRHEIERRAKRSVSIGALYSTLDRLEAKGYVASWFADPTAERGGRSKRYFRVEPLGLKAIKRSQKALAVMLEGIDLQRV
jgi:PadR family transcriptional regulator, regulatory protein PadR